MKQPIDSFIEYLFIIEEGHTKLTADQVQKLQTIKTKVTEIVNNIEVIKQPDILIPVMAESQVIRFNEYTILNEKIAKRGNSWVVLNRAGTKVLGTHPSRKKAVKQLQAIEISKAKFINESFYKTDFEFSPADFNDFEFEKELPSLIADVAEYWNTLRDDYEWNRESSDFREDHFALNVKIHVWPDSDKCREILGDSDLTDDQINDQWYRFIEDSREMYQEDIEEIYSWIENTGFGGRSGGWLVITPNSEITNVEEDVQTLIYEYTEMKADIKADDDWQEMVDLVNADHYKELIEIGVADYPKELSSLKDEALKLKSTLVDNLQTLQRIGQDLEEIWMRSRKFETNAAKYFYDELSYAKD